MRTLHTRFMMGGINRFSFSSVSSLSRGSCLSIIYHFRFEVVSRGLGFDVLDLRTTQPRVCLRKVRTITKRG